MNDSNDSDDTGATFPMLQTTEAEVNVPNISSPEVHNFRPQYAPSVQQSLENTSITIENNTPENIPILEFSNETNNTRNVMEQYARFLRDRVAGATRSRLSNIIAVTRNNNLSRQNASGAAQSDSFNRIRSLPNSGNMNISSAGEVSPMTANTDNFVSTHHSGGGSANNLNVASYGSDLHDNANAIPSHTNIQILASGQHLHLPLYIRNNAMSEIGNIPSTSNLMDQPVTNRDRFVEIGNNLTHQTTGSSNVNDSTDNAPRSTEESATSTSELYSNFYPDVVITTLRQCLHYVPFALILFVKFIYDHLLGILDIIMLQFVMYCVNKSLQAQVIKLDQKKNSIILRDLFLVVAVVTLRILLASAPPDPFGLLVGPSSGERNIIHQVVLNNPQYTNTVAQSQLSPSTQSSVERTVIIPKLISLEAILYYIAVNDLVLKLITIAMKLLVTLIPLRTIRHKSRTRLYVFMEFFSQFYRSLVPIRQWLLFLFESYSGIHAISGVMFSSTYIVLKGCELADRGKSLKKSFMNLLKDVDKSRRPAKDNIDNSDEVCAICQDTYVSPVVLECGHIFCDNCVTTWFKREQTCPICRAKVGDNLAWHDGSTSFFYQLY